MAELGFACGAGQKRIWMDWIKTHTNNVAASARVARRAQRNLTCTMRELACTCSISWRDMSTPDRLRNSSTYSLTGGAAASAKKKSERGYWMGMGGTEVRP